MMNNMHDSICDDCLKRAFALGLVVELYADHLIAPEPCCICGKPAVNYGPWKGLFVASQFASKQS